ncbi:MAG: class I SAM-dependent methyltransferase [Oscillospiraceae bacterium]|jgi:SAM-dependent methyltransferase|nr:class I SAM-dependent methyltransferase [Oscillospiraceae bacterium]
MMTVFHPGGWELSKEAIKLCGFKEGDRILDIGCGDGVTDTRMREELGLKPVGCDTDRAVLDRARRRDDKLKLRLTDGLSLDFPSLYFDGAIMECSFSLMNRHDELLHELWCVLKPGASFAVTDLYMINPDPERAAETFYEARLRLNAPREEGDCADADSLPSPYLLDGMFVIDNLIAAITDVGFELTAFRDRTSRLNDFIAQILFDYGSAEEYWKQTLPAGSKPYCRAEFGKNTGYFLLTARKPAQ